MQLAFRPSGLSALNVLPLPRCKTRFLMVPPSFNMLTFNDLERGCDAGPPPKAVPLYSGRRAAGPFHPALHGSKATASRSIVLGTQRCPQWTEWQVYRHERQQGNLSPTPWRGKTTLAVAGCFASLQNPFSVTGMMLQQVSEFGFFRLQIYSKLPGISR